MGTWDTPVNGDFNALDGFFGGVQTISLSNTNVLLTSPSGFTPTPSGGPTQSQNGVIRFTGALTGNVVVTLPLPGFNIFENLTIGSSQLQLKAIGSGQVIAIPQGGAMHVYNDGTNVRFVNLPPVGTYLDLAVSGVPGWIASCTIPPYLNCDGSTFSAATYPYLAALLGGTTLPDSRGRARYALGQGTGRITGGGNSIDGTILFAGGGTQSLALTNLPSLQLPISGITLTNASPSVFVSTIAGTPGNVSLQGNSGGSNGQITSQQIFTNVTVATQGNAALNGSGTVISSPGFVGGLTLIRAA